MLSAQLSDLNAHHAPVTTEFSEEVRCPSICLFRKKKYLFVLNYDCLEIFFLKRRLCFVSEVLKWSVPYIFIDIYIYISIYSE